MPYLPRPAPLAPSLCFLAAWGIAHAFAPAAQAVPLQIIHTNDLHSHLDHAFDPARGGYAAVKAVIDRLKGQAQAQGIDTLVLDGGDFTEDSEYYLAQQGAQSWKAMDAMGYDAVTIGNHDWLMGLKRLDELVGLTKPSFAFLGANFFFGWEQRNLVKYMKQYAEFNKAGAKIAVYGLTTDDWQYGWMADPAYVYSPLYVAYKDLPRLKARNDFVIALTHLGVKGDKFLLKNTSMIDLVVGGHSHTTLARASTQVDRRGRTIPIVQTGMHGANVGDLLVDVVPGKPIEILRYQLIPVAADGPKSEVMEQVVQGARAALDAEYGADWLREIVGFSEVPLENAYYKDEPTVWSRFVVDAIREAGQAEVGIDATQFSGPDQPPGPITREQLFVLYPRIFEFTHRYGYHIYTAGIRGWILKLVLETAFSQELPVHASGLTFEFDSHGKPIKFRIGGQPISSNRIYKVAIPEGIIRGAFGLSKLLHLVIHSVHDTGISVWEASEQKLKSVGTIRAPAAE